MKLLFQCLAFIVVLITALALMNDDGLIVDIVDLYVELFDNAMEKVSNLELKDAAKLF